MPLLLQQVVNVIMLFKGRIRTASEATKGGGFSVNAETSQGHHVCECVTTLRCFVDGHRIVTVMVRTNQNLLQT